MPARRLAFDITASSIIKILLAAVVVWAWFQLWQFFIALVVSIFLAVTFEPLARWLEKHGAPRWLASLFPVLVLIVLIIGFAVAAGSSVTEQASLVASSLANAQTKLRHTFPSLAPLLNRINSQNNLTAISRYITPVLVSTMRALVLITIGLILTVYLLIEREITVQWAVSFVPKRHRQKMSRTLSEVRAVISAYILGNLFTATLATLFVFATLTVMKVPAALVLALLAGIGDFVPLLGFVASGVPALLLAATVSKAAVIVVLVAYVFYHFCETYIIAPRIYGNRLRLSNVAVLMAFAVGAELAGVIGAMLALPIAATYPVIEKIWLSDYLATDATDRHEQILQETAKE
jgi:predicted PurR-regulated permease PerM